ncbi:MAG TPA: Uma2 family endonuclease [Blastocatellia bacterium]|nr:Uma2 family endonuclease [Blastocatellia bacterium]
MSTQREHKYSIEDYLAFDRASHSKNEYLDGTVYAMGGATARHVQIVGNVARELGNQLRDKPCVVYSTDLRVQVSHGGLYAYPDAVVVCGEPAFIDDQLDTLTNPVLIVEVLSDSTKNYDRGEKFERYRTIRSFREYLLITQDKIHIEQYVRQDDNSWVLREKHSLNDIIEPTSVGCRIPVTEIYLKISIKDPAPVNDAG